MYSTAASAAVFPATGCFALIAAAAAAKPVVGCTAAADLVAASSASSAATSRAGKSDPVSAVAQRCRSCFCEREARGGDMSDSARCRANTPLRGVTDASTARSPTRRFASRAESLARACPRPGLPRFLPVPHALCAWFARCRWGRCCSGRRRHWRIARDLGARRRQRSRAATVPTPQSWSVPRWQPSTSPPLV